MLISDSLCLDAVPNLHFSLSTLAEDLKEINKLAVDFANAVT